ncbi:type II secretion system protein GspC [Brumicola pallidula]|uniref:General secretion pathway protein C n=1 Tax=Brumicola pallidula DSM 14239 = ACAM 615 TaxID=1121922 RepID=K6ZWA9_9ALTE|nr:type II secretion system protein GspC [Glaciecola pallidula]GAC27605.1 general secretion pathway protein C [Glaciecola pallidula DSM 14239 = ACAM 615]
MMHTATVHNINITEKMTVTNLSLQPALRMYSQHQNKIILLIVVLLSLYLIAFAAELTWRLVPQPESSQSRLLNNSNTSTAQSASRLDISPLTKLNLFGNPDAKPIVTALAEITDAPETKLNLTLTGVVSSTDPKVGAAVVENNGKQNTYGVGDKIDGTNATLDQLYIDRVIIKNGLARETLMLDGIDFNEANQIRQQGYPQQAQEFETPQGPVEFQMPDSDPDQSSASVREMREQINQSPTSFTDFIAIKPHAPNGALIGYQVSPGKQAEFFSNVGLRSGDVITQINGLDLSDPAQSLEAINVLREAQFLQMEVLRGDEALSLDIDIPSSEE